MNPVPPPAPARRLLVACLCARWCGLCEDYRAVFDAARAEQAGRADFLWVDIEDDERLLGPVEVDDFPTLLVADQHGPLFLGPLTPQPSVLARLLRSAQDGDLQPLGDAAGAALAGRLRAAVAGRPAAAFVAPAPDSSQPVAVAAPTPDNPGR